MSSSPRRVALPTFGLVLVLMGCSREAAEQSPPPVPVEIVTVVAGAVPNIIELPGRIEAVRMAEVRARTDGVVERRLYEEGADVKAGTALFTIDPRDYQAQVQAADATLKRALAAHENAASIFKRYEPLISGS